MSETLGGGTSSSSQLLPFPEVREEKELLASCVGEVLPFLMGGSSLFGNAVVEVIVLDLPEQSLWLMGT